jgi:hypothetical protein
VELRVIDTENGRVVFQDYNVTDAEFFAKRCLEYNGRYQVYFSAQPRDGKGGSYENVPALTFIPIDVDAVRPNKKSEPADASQRFNAERNVAKILKHLKSRGVQPSLVVDTGNGFLILVRIPRQETSPHFYKEGDSTRNKLSDMVNWFLQHEIKPLCDDTVEIDSVGDLPRILGVPNTVNMKGMRVRRVILGDVTKPPETQPAMWRLIEESWKRRDTKEATAVTTISRDVDALMAMLPANLREGYEKPSVGKRSDVLVRTLLHLANNRGLTKDECVVAMEPLTRKIGRERWPAAQQYDKLLAEGKIRPTTFSLGEFTVRVKKDLAIVYGGDEPIYPIEIRKLKSTTARKNLAKSLGIDVELVHPVAAKLLDLLLSKRKTPFAEQKSSESAESTRVDAEVVKRAEALLRDPLLLCRVAKGLHKTGLVGETKNGLLTFLTMVSSKLPDPINLRLSHRASIGKSTIVTKAAMLYPPEDMIVRGGLTKKALYYLPEAEDVDEKARKLVLRGKVLVILEESESQDFLNEAKPLLSHDVPTLKYSFVEEKVTKTVLLEGWPAYIGVTTIPIKGEEHRTRTLLVSPDRGKEKYGAVIDDDAERHAFPWMYKAPDVEVFHEAVRRLKPLRVWTPWLPIVSKEFPKKKASSMRDWKKLRTYIEAVAFLHQYQRPHIVIDGVEYIVAIPLDLEIATKIVEGAMAETIMGLERDVKEFYDFINEKVLTIEETEAALKDKTKKDELKETFTYKDLMKWYEECFGEPISKTTLRDRYVEKLEDLGLLEIDTSKKPYKISLCSESSASLANFEKALLKVRSEETKAQIIRKTLAKLKDVQGEFLDAFEKNYFYSLSNFADLKKLLERSKSEEYPEKTFFLESAKDADDFSKTTSSPEAGEVVQPAFPSVEEDISEPRQLAGELYHQGVCSSCGRETQISFYCLDSKGQRHELCSKCAHEMKRKKIVSKLKAEWSEDLTQEEIIDRMVQLGLSQIEAKSLFDQLAGSELFWHDKDGKTLWGWA